NNSLSEQLLRMSSVHPISDSLPGLAPPLPRPPPHRWFPSYRSLTAILLCVCFAAIHMMNCNLSMSVVCMINTTETDRERVRHDGGFSSNETGFIRLEGHADLVNWTPEEEGIIFSAFNLGLLFMLITGVLADKLNAKWMILGSVAIAVLATMMIPILTTSFYWAVLARFLIGLSDAMLQPAVNSLLTRWFPASERSYALSIATGGRQLGTLMITPVAGALCQSTLFGGWPAIFVLSALAGVVFIAIYLFLGADKPSKLSCISEAELKFITMANTAEDCGKKRNERKVPWKRILLSGSVWSAVVAVVCHEFPLMTMIMFLPSYLHDVHHYTATTNGLLSSLPTLALWIAKILSSYCDTWLKKHTRWSASAICKFLNGIGSLGLGVFLYATTLLDASHAWLAVLFLCLSMFFAGLHTPGCQAALVAIAPAYSGAVTGLAFFFVASSGIVNPILTKWIVQNQSAEEWNLVFYISTVFALLPCITFSVWGTADIQWWAKSEQQQQYYKDIKSSRKTSKESLDSETA
ncbi:hypothetical protein PENTCL1PPCAC_2695, partial [Pristionchus entomophagus]